MPFNPGHATYEQDFNLDRRKQQLGIQSTQISRAIRVARPGPQFNSSILLNGSGNSGAHRPLDHGLVRGLSQDSSLVTQGSLSANNNIHPRVTPSQSVSNTLWRQEPGTSTTGLMTTLSKQQQQQSQPQQQLLHHHQQQYHPNPADSLEAKQASILSSAQPIPQYSDSPKREPISAFAAMGQGNSRLSSGSSSSHSMMSARVASQPQQPLQQQQPHQQLQQQQRQQTFLSTDNSSGFMTGPAYPQSLQQNGFQPPVTILNDQQLPLYDSPQPFGTPQAQLQTPGQHQQQQSSQQQQFDQQLMLQLPVSASGTPTGIQHHQAQPYQFQAQPHLQQQQQQQRQQMPYIHQPHQRNDTQQQQLNSPLGPNHAISSAAPVSSVAIPSGVQPPSQLEAWASSTTNEFSAAAAAASAGAQNQIDWKSSSISQPTSLDYPNRPFNPQTDPHYGFSRSPIAPTTPTTTATSTTSTTPLTAIPSLAGSPVVFSGDYGQQQQKLRNNGAPLRQQVFTSSPIQSRTEEQRDEATRIRKIAKDLLDCQQYDYGVFLPRHISQEYPDIWVAPHSNQPGGLDGIPRQLLVLPKDANFLVDVFFEVR